MNGLELRARLGEAASAIEVGPFEPKAVEQRARARRRASRTGGGAASFIAVTAVVALSLVIPQLASRGPEASQAARDDTASTVSGARSPIAPDELGPVLATVATDVLEPLVGQLSTPQIRIADQARRRLSAHNYGWAAFAQVSFLGDDSIYTLTMDYSPAETEGLGSYCENMLNGFSVSCQETTANDKVVIVETRHVFVTIKNGSIGDSEVAAPGHEPSFGGEPWIKRMVSVVDLTTHQRTAAAEWVRASDETFKSLSHPPLVPIETLTNLAERPELVMNDPNGR